jgi:serine/threonine-protein kinase
MTRCPDPLELQRLLDNQLSGEEYQRVEAHVETCPCCRQALEALNDAELKDVAILQVLRGSLFRDSVDPPALALPTSSADLSTGRDREALQLQPPKLLPSPASDGRYRLLEVIGRGGMGVVYRAYDTDCCRRLAVKVLLEKYRSDADLERRFLGEAQLTAQLQHPGVVPVHEIGRLPDGRPFFAMKLVEGRTLDQLLQERQSPLEDLPRWVDIFGQVCQAVAYAHSHRLIHRDLKPANVMVGAFGEVQVMDWGLAKALADRGGARPDAGGEPEDRSALHPVWGERPGTASRHGAVLGTLGYMAPEQARGAVGQLDERCDVFSLGAILCEVLTGQAPYDGDTAEAVHLRASQGDLEGALKRLDACGADAELLQLARHCLALRAEDRPRDGGAVAQTVAAYRAGVEERLRRAELEWATEQARAAEAQAKAAAERRARRLTAALSASVLAAALLGGVGWLWLERQHDAMVRAVAEDAHRAELLQEQERWPDALQAVERAEARLAGGGPDHLREHVAQLRAELEAVNRLHEALLQQYTLTEEQQRDYAGSDRAYAEAFAGHGLDLLAPGEGRVVERIRQSGIRRQLVAALDDWALVKLHLGDGSAERLREVAGLADDDPWRRGLRDPAVRNDTAAMERLAAEEIERLAARDTAQPQPKANLRWLSVALVRTKSKAAGERLLRQAQQRYPEDFWINFELADSLSARPADVGEAIGFYRAALAVRPRCAVAHNNLGYLLAGQGRLAEAEACFRAALEARPAYAQAHYNLALLLAGQGKSADAEASYRAALKTNPDLDAVYNNLGNLLGDLGRLAEAEASHRAALKINPGLAQAHYNLGIVLQRQEKSADAESSYRAALKVRPTYAQAHYNLGLLLAGQGRPAEAEACFRAAIEARPNYTQAHYSLGNLLKRQGRLAEAEASYRAALKVNPGHAKAHNNLGNLLAGQGRLAEAEACFRAALKARPDYALAYCNLGQALCEQGRFTEAQESLRRGHELGSKIAGWPYPSARWLNEAERLVWLDARAPKILKGDEKPPSPAEQVELARMCHRYKKLYATAVRLYSGAFKAQPQLAEDLSSANRFNAACAAALAGCSQGTDTGGLNGKERAHLREQALGWLRADLIQWSKLLENDPKQARARVQQLKQWQKDAALAGVRGEEALARLPEAERQEWQRLWAEVAQLLERTEREKPSTFVRPKRGRFEAIKSSSGESEGSGGRASRP